MADNVAKKKRPRSGFRFQMELTFDDQDSKKIFLSRLDKAKGLLSSSTGSRNVDNFALLSSLLDVFEGKFGGDGAQSAGSLPDAMPANPKTAMLKHSGKCCVAVFYLLN